MLPERTALLAAAVFAVHPTVSEAVIYVWGRSILLAAVFCLLSLRAWLRERRWTAVAWFAAALLSKEEAAAFPLVLLLLDRRHLKPVAAMLLLDAAAAVRVIHAASVTPGALIAQEAGIAPLSYLLAQGSAVLRYLRLVIVPWGFTIDPDGAVYSRTVALASWGALAVLAALAWRRRDRGGWWVLAGLILLLPSSSVFPAADLAADRRLYLPMAAFAVALALLLRRWRWEASVLVCGVLALLSIGRTRVWMSDERLWREAVERSPDKVRPKLHLARRVPVGEALPLLAEAERLAPGDPAVPAEREPSCSPPDVPPSPPRIRPRPRDGPGQREQLQQSWNRPRRPGTIRSRPQRLPPRPRDRSRARPGPRQPAPHRAQIVH